MRTPSITALQSFCQLMARANIEFALGGSGLMSSLGLIEEVNDWDITTDATWERVAPLLEGLDYELFSANEIFATNYRFRITFEGDVIDLMGGFAIKTPDGVEPIKTIVTQTWNGVPVGCPKEWSKAYELMGRKAKAVLLQNYLASKT